MLARLAREAAWGYLAFLLLLTGPFLLFDPSRTAPSTIYAGLPIYLVYGWGVALTVGGAGILAGVLSGLPWIERIGHAWLIVAMLVWLACIAAVDFMPNRIGAIAAYLGMVAAMGARYRALGRPPTSIEIPKSLQ